MSPLHSPLNPSASSSRASNPPSSSSQSRKPPTLEPPRAYAPPSSPKADSKPASGSTSRPTSESQPLMRVSPSATPAQSSPTDWILSGALAIATGVLAIASSVYGLTQWRHWNALEREHQTILEQAHQYRTQQDYPACLTAASQISTYSRLHSEAKTLQTDCANQQAEIDIYRSYRLAADGEVNVAIALANTIPPTATVYADAQQAIASWSQQLLDKAQQEYWQPTDSFDIALETLEAIPENAAIYAQAQQYSEDWKAEWSRNQTHWQAAQEALNRREPEVVRQEVSQITTHPYWQTQAEQILGQAEQQEQELRYEAFWQAAQQALAQNEPQRAITEAQNLPDVLPWSERKQSLISRAEARIHSDAFCRGFSMGILNRCPGL